MLITIYDRSRYVALLTNKHGEVDNFQLCAFVDRANNKLHEEIEKIATARLRICKTHKDTIFFSYCYQRMSEKSLWF